MQNPGGNTWWSSRARFARFVFNSQEAEMSASRFEYVRSGFLGHHYGGSSFSSLAQKGLEEIIRSAYDPIDALRALHEIGSDGLAAVFFEGLVDHYLASRRFPDDSHHAKVYFRVMTPRRILLRENAHVPRSRTREMYFPIGQYELNADSSALTLQGGKRGLERIDWFRLVCIRDGEGRYPLSIVIEDE